MSTDHLRVVVCDPHRLVCDCIGRLMQDEFADASVYGCPDLTRLIETVRSTGSSLVLLQVPPCDPAVIGRLVHSIRAGCPGAALICLADPHDVSHIRALRDAGVDACVLTGDSKTVLFAAIRAVLRGDEFICPAVGTIVRDMDHPAVARWAGAGTSRRPGAHMRG
jgi:DNA-binding NarL/FixJ family response regulator